MAINQKNLLERKYLCNLNRVYNELNDDLIRKIDNLYRYHGIRNNREKLTFEIVRIFENFNDSSQEALVIKKTLEMYYDMANKMNESNLSYALDYVAMVEISLGISCPLYEQVRELYQKEFMYNTEEEKKRKR